MSQTEMPKPPSGSQTEMPPPPPVYGESSTPLYGQSPTPVPSQSANQWAMILHLSHFAGYLIPYGGLIVPIVIWQIKKNEMPILDVHGKNIVNWIITETIATVVGLILYLTVIGMIIGVPLLIAVGILGIIFPIIGAIKANNGEVWKYPLTIDFIK